MTGKSCLVRAQVARFWHEEPALRQADNCVPSNARRWSGPARCILRPTPLDLSLFPGYGGVSSGTVAWEEWHVVVHFILGREAGLTLHLRLAVPAQTDTW